jgi:hypothetical protein
LDRYLNFVMCSLENIYFSIVQYACLTFSSHPNSNEY